MATGTQEIAASDERTAAPPPGRVAPLVTASKLAAPTLAARGVLLAVAGGALVWAALAAAYVLTR